MVSYHKSVIAHRYDTRQTLEESCLLSSEIQVTTDFILYFTAPLHGFPSFLVTGEVKTEKTQDVPSYSTFALSGEGQTGQGAF